MDTIASLLVLSTLLHIVTPEVFTQTSFRATVEITEGDSRIFSGENIRLKCSFSGDDSPSWNYLWFKGSEKLQHSRKVLILWNTKVQQSGKYYCQGVRESPIGKIRTLQSLPEEIYVDGGWAILSVPPKPGLVGNTLNLMCRVRENPPVHEIILYKDGVEVMRRNGPEPYFKLTNLTIKDHGMYSCRASFDTRRRTVSVTSTQSHVQILEVLTEPHLEIDVDFDPYQPSWMRLVCHLQYNAPAHAPQVDYYFYRNNNQVGPSSSESYRLVQKIPGHYQCKASVLDLGLVRWSKSRSFGKIKEV
ncbi:low affinity immunoglobulin gamma Fc region receptor III-A-like isoform 2-T2 [Pholidichthys leucotaenia]